jgi:hypothetical protein
MSEVVRAGFDLPAYSPLDYLNTKDSEISNLKSQITLELLAVNLQSDDYRL